MLCVEPMVLQLDQMKYTISYLNIYLVPLYYFFKKFKNKIWISGDFSSDWIKAIVIPIPKPGRNKTNPTNYHPIAFNDIDPYQYHVEVCFHLCITTGIRMARRKEAYFIYLFNDAINTFYLQLSGVYTWYEITCYVQKWQSGGNTFVEMTNNNTFSLIHACHKCPISNKCIN